MIIIGLDVHKTFSQLLAFCEETGEVILEMPVETTADALRRVVSGIQGPKKVIFEEGPMSALIHDALKDVAEVVSCDSTRNALIARAEDSSDERDARRLVTLEIAGALRKVYVPDEPYRTLRSLTNHEYNITGAITMLKNRIKALCRRHGIKYKGKGIYNDKGRARVLKGLANRAYMFQAESLYRQLDHARQEKLKTFRMISKVSKDVPVIEQLKTIPGLKSRTAPVVAAWVAGPERFKSRKALQSYAGLGIGQGFTNWKPVGRARASRRGQRRLKRALFIAARAAIKGHNRLAERYRAHLLSGWSEGAAIRDVAKRILFIACRLWRKGTVYSDALVAVPEAKI